MNRPGFSKASLLNKKAKLVLNQVKFKNMFKTESEKVAQEMQLLVSLLSESKRDKKATFMIYHICQKMPFYKQLTQRIMKDSNFEVLIKFFEGARYEKHPKDTVLIKEDDRYNTKAYVVIKGRVGILRSNKYDVRPQGLGNKAHDSSKMEGGLTVSPQNLSPNGHLSTIAPFGGSFRIIGDEQAEPKKPGETEDQLEETKIQYYDGLSRPQILFLRKYGTMVGITDKGNIFGDVALTTDSPRTASAVTLEETELIVFTRENFQHILMYYTVEYFEKKNFLSSLLPQMEEITENKWETNFVHSFQHVKFRKVDLADSERCLDKRRPGRQEYLYCQGRRLEDLQRTQN